MEERVRGASKSSVPKHERQLYSLTRAFGRFGMRIFPPQAMDNPHWHGHIEVNYLTGASMVYDLDGDIVEVPPNRCAVFWAGIPHQLIDIKPTGDSPPKLANIYIPLDAFLYLSLIAEMQIELLGGAVLLLPEAYTNRAQIERWYADYRTNDFERIELVKMELNALFRRAVLDGLDYLLEPRAARRLRREVDSTRTRHVVAMLRYILENLDKPMTNGQVASVTGLHANYALTLFSRTMHMPLKRFILRMRLLRARVLLLESTLPVASVADLSGFTSVSQFYIHFKETYGLPPNALRNEFRSAKNFRGVAAGQRL